MVQVAAVVLLVLGAWLWHVHEVSAARIAGWDAAVAAGKAKYEADAAKARKTESELRAQLRDKDDEANELERTYEISLEVAQRDVRAGRERLRCPTAGPVHAAAPAPAAGPAAGEPAPDGPGADLVPEVAADVLGLAADGESIVRKYDRIVERFEACRALNNGTPPAD
jgi:hypothetical protein